MKHLKPKRRAGPKQNVLICSIHPVQGTLLLLSKDKWYLMFFPFTTEFKVTKSMAGQKLHYFEELSCGGKEDQLQYCLPFQTEWMREIWVGQERQNLRFGIRTSSLLTLNVSYVTLCKQDFICDLSSSLYCSRTLCGHKVMECQLWHKDE